MGRESENQTRAILVGGERVLSPLRYPAHVLCPVWCAILSPLEIYLSTQQLIRIHHFTQLLFLITLQVCQNYIHLFNPVEWCYR